MSAREEILRRVRSATADVTAPVGTVTRPAVPAEESDERTLTTFAEMVADYRAEVVRVPAARLPEAIATALREHGCRTAVVPDGLDPAWVDAVAGVAQVRREAGTSTHADLDATDAVVTAAAVGIAATGTIVLDHRADQGRRALTLIPDTHVCVVRSEQVVPDVPQAVQRLRPDPQDARPQTWISGPSATSDIELERVEGVHGPRTLVMILVEG
jgi:L-lactate dehydrogenase complex protein LldG